MKIVFISPGITKNEDYKGGNLGGIETQIYGLAKEFLKRGNEVYIIRKWRKPIDVESFEGIKIINIHSPINIDSDIRISPFGAVLSRLIYSKLAARKVGEIKPDIMLMNERLSTYFVSKLDVFKVFVIHIPPYDFMKNYLTENNRLKHCFSVLLDKLEENAMNRSNIIVALNKDIQLYQQTKRINTAFIPNGIDIEKYKEGCDGGYILYGGRLVDEKGIHHLLQAYSEIKEELQNRVKLMIIGSGPSEKSLKAIAKSMGIVDRVDFIHWLPISEFREKVKNCSVFVLPSVFETFGIVVIEAMASGKPVIASDIPGPRDIITHGKDGLLFEKQSSKELSKHLELLLEDKTLMENLGENARKTVENNYTFEKISTKYLELFEEKSIKR